MSLIDKLKWRYATKKMDSTKAVPAEKVERILEAVRLSASSSGLQPYELLVITNKDLREKIKAVANNQAQIWHRMNTSLLGDTVQVGFTLSDAQMRDPDFNNQFSEIELCAFVIDLNPSQMLV